MSDSTEVVVASHQEIKMSRDGIIFVGSSTNTKGLASCIFASSTKEGKTEIRLRGIGAGAVCQMSKAYIIAKGKLTEKGISSSVDMYFKDIASKREGEDTITSVEYLICFK